MRIQTLREQGLGAKAIRGSYPDKTGAWARCRRFAVGSMRRDQLWRDMRVAVGRRGLHVPLKRLQWLASWCPFQRKWRHISKNI